uniref:Uncharacterized protein MANES_03G089900 n=1 Tax=Rhizophora mucronata TaxID=61149 RepID=A0A2P2QN70_RHIMU
MLIETLNHTYTQNPNSPNQISQTHKTEKFLKKKKTNQKKEDRNANMGKSIIANEFDRNTQKELKRSNQIYRQINK